MRHSDLYGAQSVLAFAWLRLVIWLKKAGARTPPPAWFCPSYIRIFAVVYIEFLRQLSQLKPWENAPNLHSSNEISYHTIVINRYIIATSRHHMNHPKITYRGARETHHADFAPWNPFLYPYSSTTQHRLIKSLIWWINSMNISAFCSSEPLTMLCCWGMAS